MATSKQGFVRAAEPQHSLSAQREKDVRVQAPLAAMYIQALPSLPTYPQAQPVAMQEPTVIPLSVPVMCSNQTLPLLTLHIAGGPALQQQRPETLAPSSRPKSSGKHVCPHCRRDCLKPSVLEKHLRCHTGERPYPCTTCGISFKTQSNLYKHKRTQAHARLSNESGKGTFSSQESTESSRETCSSSSLELQSEDSIELNKSDRVSAPATMSQTISSTQVSSAEKKTGSGTEWALRKAAVVGLIASPAHGQQEKLHATSEQILPEAKNEAAPIQTKSLAGDGRSPLQRQKALFSKLSRGKTQVSSYDSTDSGFSEGSEQHLTSSPLDNPHNRSMESLTESSMELQEPEKPPDVATKDAKAKVSVQEKQKLEEHILKLISENSVLVDDKDLVNVRPRKTMLYKQGSIDLPMPYTYKDSFHFEMRSSKHVSGSFNPDTRGRPTYSSVPTQYSASLEHAPLTRSSSLPFSVGIQNRDRTVSLYQGDSTPLSRRCSAGNISLFKSVDQHAPSHRSLVRQVAMDCLSSAEGPPTDRGSLSNLSSDGDCVDPASEALKKPQGRRKKAQRFAYNKWYMYGDGTFKKLYDTEKDGLLKSRKSVLGLEQRGSQVSQTTQQQDNTSAVSVSFASCSAVCLPPAVNVLAPQTSSQVISSYVLLQSTQIKQSATPSLCSLDEPSNVPSSDSEANLTKRTEENDKKAEHPCPVPSERKKQKTEENVSAVMKNTDTIMRQQSVLASGSGQTKTNLCNLINQSPPLVEDDACQRSSLAVLQKDNKLNLCRQGSFTNPSSANQRQTLFKRHSSPLFVTNMTGTSGFPSASLSISAGTQAKSSFLPKYQLKIPCSADGVSDPCPGNSSSQNLTSSNQPFRQSHHTTQQILPGTSLPSASQNQSATVTSSGQHQEVSLCTVSVKRTNSLTSFTEENTHTTSNKHTGYQTDSCTSASTIMTTIVSSIAQNTPTNTLMQSPFTACTAHNMSAGSVSSVLSQPLQTFTALGQNQSVAVNTTQSAISQMSHYSPSTKNTAADATCAGATSTVQNNLSVSTVISRQTSPPTMDAHVSACQNPTDGSPLEVSHAAGVQFEGKMLLLNDSLQSLAQDTFYVRTADLQIVMQLISDEQLALIEPQIETQDFKMEASQLSVSKDSETSGTGAVRTGVSQETTKQCPGDTETKLDTVHRNVNSSHLDQISDTTATSAKTTSTKNATDSMKAVFGLHSQNIYMTNAGTMGITSSSSSKMELQVSAEPESKSYTLEQFKSISPAPERNILVRERESSGCDNITASYLKQRPAETLGGLPLTDKTVTKTQSVPMTCGSSVPNSVSRNLSESAVSGKEQSCQDIAGGREAGGREEETLLPEDSILVDTPQPVDSNNQSETMIIEQQKSLSFVPSISKPVEGEKQQTETCSLDVPRIPLTTVKAAVSSQENLIPNAQPSHPKSKQLTCAPFTPARQTSLGKVLSHTASQHPVINRNGNEGNKDSLLVQAPAQHLHHQDSFSLGGKVSWRNSNESRALTARHAPSTGAHFESDRPVSRFTQEESIKCGEALCGNPYISQVPHTGPQVGGALQSSQLRREPGTGSQGCVPQEPESGGEGGGDEEERVRTWAAEAKNTSPELEDRARKTNEEGVTRSNGAAEKPHPCLSQPLTNISQDTSLLAQLDTSGESDNTAATFCEARSLSRDFGQREGSCFDSSEQVINSDNRVKGPPKRISQSKAKEKDQPECQKKVTSLATASSDAKRCHPTCGQDDKRETQLKISSPQLRSSQLQSYEHKKDDTIKPSVPHESCITVQSCNPETCRLINASPVRTNPNCTNVTINNYAIQSNPTFLNTNQNNPTDSNPPQCHLGGSYVEESESSSSSDDEGKLVIELESDNLIYTGAKTP